jgi:hypothetical protein
MHKYIYIYTSIHIYINRTSKTSDPAIKKGFLDKARLLYPEGSKEGSGGSKGGSLARYIYMYMYIYVCIHMYVHVYIYIYI